jgi:hypothetical protein
LDNFTPVKKMMTEKMIRLYCSECHGSPEPCDECKESLDRSFRHLDACRFKDKGWPCVSCQECCFKGKDYDDLMKLMTFAQKWMEENPDKAEQMRPPVPPNAP